MWPETFSWCSVFVRRCFYSYDTYLLVSAWTVCHVIFVSLLKNVTKNSRTVNLLRTNRATASSAGVFLCVCVSVCRHCVGYKVLSLSSWMTTYNDLLLDPLDLLGYSHRHLLCDLWLHVLYCWLHWDFCYRLLALNLNRSVKMAHVCSTR